MQLEFKLRSVSLQSLCSSHSSCPWWVGRGHLLSLSILSLLWAVLDNQITDWGLLNGQGCVFLVGFQCLGDRPMAPPPGQVDSCPCLRMTGWVGSGLGVGWDWWSSRAQACAASTSLRPVVPGRGQEVVCGSSDEAEGMRCGSA